MHCMSFALWLVSASRWLIWIVGWWWLRQRGVNVSTLCNVRIPACLFLRVCVGLMMVLFEVVDVCCVGQWPAMFCVVGVGWCDLFILFSILLSVILFFVCLVFRLACVWWHFYGEFDPGSGRTLAACLTHASRTERPLLAEVLEWRTGE